MRMIQTERLDVNKLTTLGNINDHDNLDKLKRVTKKYDPIFNENKSANGISQTHFW